MGRAQECIPGRLPLVRFQELPAAPQRVSSTTAVLGSARCLRRWEAPGCCYGLRPSWHQGKMPLRTGLANPCTVSLMRYFEAVKCIVQASARLIFLWPGEGRAYCTLVLLEAEISAIMGTTKLLPICRCLPGIPKTPKPHRANSWDAFQRTALQSGLRKKSLSCPPQISYC